MKDQSEIVRLRRPVDNSDHVLGPQAALVILVEYGDYECIHCRRLHPIIQEIMKRTEGLLFVYRHFPISQVHPHAIRAAEGAEAAGAQGRFWEMHDALFRQAQPLSDERLARLARKTGLDMERYTREMAEGIYGRKVEEDFNSALYGDGVTGTPTVYLNGVRLSNLRSPAVLLDAAIEAGATLRSDTGERSHWRSELHKFRVGMTRHHL